MISKITFEDIKKANESIVTTGIEKKDKKTGNVSVKQYAEVNQRIKAFRMVNPNGCISTQIISMENDSVLMKAEVRDEFNNLIGTGYAQEVKGASYINSTSYIENCETSAVGRALGMCGFGIDTSIASYEEVQNAIKQQEELKQQAPIELATPKQIEMLAKNYTGENLTKLLKANNIEKLEDMPKEKASELIGKLLNKSKGSN